MPSESLKRWRAQRRGTLDHLELAHGAVRSSGPGGRAASQQVNHAYAVLLSAQFQGFCRDLHYEAVVQFVSLIEQAGAREVVQRQLVSGRKLDSGNPNPGNLGADFGRFGLDLWTAMASHDPRILPRRSSLEEMNAWRNAIAHQHLDPRRLDGRTSLPIHVVRGWRRACEGLVRSLDVVVRARLVSLGVAHPWPVR